MKGGYNLDRKEIFEAITIERARQEELHPRKKIKPTGDEETDLLQNLLLHYEMLPVLVEEVGEVATALQGEGSLKEELIQVASVCTRWLESLQ